MRLIKVCQVYAIALVAALSSSASGQDSDDEGVLSQVEDSTLDGSGEEAASAANAVASPEPPPSAAENKPAEIAPVTEGEPAVEAPVETSTAEKTAEEPVTEDPAVTAKDQASTEQESAQQETADAEPAVPETPVAEAKTDDPREKEAVTTTESTIKGTYGGRVFGRYKIQLAMNKPTFNEGTKCYDKLYGKPTTHFSMGGDWFPLDWWVNPGVVMRMGMYSVRGKAVKGVASGSTTVDCDTLTVDDNSKTTLLFIPIQLGGKIQVSPFSRKWVVLDFWSAGEYGWWQETRDNTATASIMLETSKDASTRVYTNTGRKTAMSTGMSAHILLNTIDERSVRSMIDSMGIGYVYLTGFMETVKSTSKQGLSFGRNVLGIGFTFETVK